MAETGPCWRWELAPTDQAGRRFEPLLERELSTDLRALASGLPGARNGVVLAPEFAGPIGIADLVALTRFDEHLTARRLSNIAAVESLADCAVVSQLSPHRGHTPAYVARSTGTSHDQVRRRLGRLCGTGAVRREGNTYTRHPAVRPIGHVYSLEAKVSDWRRGLEQATRYAGWSDASAVVLLTEPADLSEVARRFRALRIGLALRDQWVVRPTLGRPDGGLRLAASERLAAAIGHQ